jgi:hypothetical protein
MDARKRNVTDPSDSASKSRRCAPDPLTEAATTAAVAPAGPDPEAVARLCSCGARLRTFYVSLGEGVEMCPNTQVRNALWGWCGVCVVLCSFARPLRQPKERDRCTSACALISSTAWSTY